MSLFVLEIDPIRIAIGLIVVLLVASFGLSLYILAHRLQMDRRASRTRRLRQAWMPLVLDSLSEPATAASLTASISRRDRSAFADFVFGLAESLEGDDVDRLRELLEGCGMLGRARAALGRRDRGAILHALVLIARFHDRLGLDAVRRLIAHDARHDVGFASAAALAAIGDLGDVEIVFRRLVGIPNRSEHVISQVMLSFGAGLAESLGTLLRRGDLPPRAEGIAIDLIGVLGHLPAVAFLTERAANATAPDLRRRIVTALGRMGSPSALPFAAEALASDDEGLRLTAATALRRLGSEDSIAVLSGRLDDPSALVRHAVATALLEIGGEGRRLVERMAADPGEEPRLTSARAALGEWTGEIEGAVE